MNSKKSYKFKQINDFNWINIKAVNEIIKLISGLFSKNAEFEKKIGINVYYNKNQKNQKIKKINEINLDEPETNKKIVGSIDCFDYIKKNIWEFKFVDELKDEHFFQLVTYGMILYGNSNWHQKIRLKFKNFNLMNVKNKEIYNIKINFKKWKNWLFLIIYFHDRDSFKFTDSEFIRICLDKK